MVCYFCGMEGVFMSKVKWNKKEEVMYEKKMKVYKRKLVRFKENQVVYVLVMESY